ncbi:opsin 4b isoform X2 [Brachyhypopomus gauderio]|uniref:opsin 4b isoform X2 n=1 Tax=Brachyhypopomus gauderio TaxID=698409 RepID=UPI004040F4B7
MSASVSTGVPSSGKTPVPWNHSAVRIEQPALATSAAMVQDVARPFPTVDVPDHAHYTIGCVIFVIGITGMVGNFLVIYAFCKSRSLRTPANMFVINLAITDLLMCVTQTPTFFITSMHKRWIFGEKACELYAFCGAMFGICSMITLMIIALDRYFVITRPLTSIGKMSHKRALIILTAAWMYTMGWSLPPFFGWSAYVPEGLLTSCTWDYVTFTPSVRAYTMMLFVFVFFIPLFVIMYCYSCIFRAIRNTTSAVEKIDRDRGSAKDSLKKFNRMKSEWKMAKVALIVILLYVISWSPYACVALTAFAGYADILTPYMNSVPAVIAKASAIHNPIIYAITHPKYRAALATYVPCLGALLCVPQGERFTTTTSFTSTRRSTVTSRASECSNNLHCSTKSRLSTTSNGELVSVNTEAEPSRLAGRQASGDARKVPTELKHGCSVRGTMKESDSYDRSYELSPVGPAVNTTISAYVSMSTLADKDDISMAEVSHSSYAPATVEQEMLSGTVPSIVVSSGSVPVLQSGRASEHPSKYLPGSSPFSSATVEHV